MRSDTPRLPLPPVQSLRFWAGQEQSPRQSPAVPSSSAWPARSKLATQPLPSRAWAAARTRQPVQRYTSHGYARTTHRAGGLRVSDTRFLSRIHSPFRIVQYTSKDSLANETAPQFSKNFPLSPANNRSDAAEQSFEHGAECERRQITQRAENDETSDEQHSKCPRIRRNGS